MFGRWDFAKKAGLRNAEYLLRKTVEYAKAGEGARYRFIFSMVGTDFV